MPVIQTVPVILAPEEKWERYKAAKDRRQKAATVRLRNYYYDPVAFIHDCIEWPEGQEITPYQEETLRRLIKYKRVGVRGPHGLGKTATEALAILWFVITREAAEKDWKVISTAGAWRQLEKYLWPEIHKWAKRIRWERLGRGPFTRHELLSLHINLKHGTAFAVASDNADFIEGAHADSILYVFDEAKAIEAKTWEAAEGAFSGDEETTEAFALACSTPGEPNGVFYEIHARTPKFPMWHAFHVTLEMAITAGRVSRKWAEDAKLMWGATSAAYANRVLGEFMSSAEDGVIPLSWIEAAVERWKANEGRELGPLTTDGVDVARSGEDVTVQALRYGSRIQELRPSKYSDLMVTTGLVKGVLDANPGAIAIVDTDGLGAGVTDRLREQGHPVVAFHAGAKSDAKDKSGELGFVNKRAAAWWALREKLDPSNDPDIELPDDPELLGDLTAPHWTVQSDSRILIEPKKEIKKRIGRSTDKGDAVVQAFWEERKKKKRRMMDSTDLGMPDAPPKIAVVGAGMVAA
jgi:hypothetical protein